MFECQAHKGLTQMLKKYTFVGMVDLHLSLVQFNTKLVLVNHTELRRETISLRVRTVGRRATSPRVPLKCVLSDLRSIWGASLSPDL